MLGSETATPTLDFFVAIATVIPIAFLAGVVEIGLSATSWRGVETHREQTGFDAFVEASRVVAMAVLVIASVVGEFFALYALWHGHDLHHSGVVASVALGADGMILLWMVSFRLSARVVIGGFWSTTAFKVVYFGFAILLIALIVVLIWLLR
jgi:hypothetical protein